MIRSNYIVFDCETGGLSKDKNPITQFACVVLDGKTLKEIDRWETYVKPYGGLKIEKQALDHTMVNMSDINKGLSVEDFVSTLIEFLEVNRAKTKKKEIGRLVPVGHNVTFDIGFLNYALNLCNKGNLNEWMYPNIIDTFPMAKLAFGVSGEEKLNLGACCERAKIKLTDAHGAMNDVEATAELLRWYMRKLRSKRGVSSEETESSGRKRGNEFFEFKCSVK